MRFDGRGDWAGLGENWGKRGKYASNGREGSSSAACYRFLLHLVLPCSEQKGFASPRANRGKALSLLQASQKKEKKSELRRTQWKPKKKSKSKQLLESTDGFEKQKRRIGQYCMQVLCRSVRRYVNASKYVYLCAYVTQQKRKAQMSVESNTTAKKGKREHREKKSRSQFKRYVQWRWRMVVYENLGLAR